MKLFIENDCRTCGETFCCEKCRLKHEESNHGINLECNLCVYGKAYVFQLHENIMPHVIEKHFPLYCIFCGKQYNTSTFSNCNCKLDNINESKITPHKTNNSTSIGETPIVSADNKNNLKITTSTPMQEEGEFITFNNMSEVITSIERVKSSSLKTLHVSKNQICQIEKKEIVVKRVTFCESSLEMADKMKSLRKSFNNERPSTSTSLGEKEIISIPSLFDLEGDRVPNSSSTFPCLRTSNSNCVGNSTPENSRLDFSLNENMEANLGEKEQSTVWKSALSCNSAISRSSEVFSDIRNPENSSTKIVQRSQGKFWTILPQFMSNFARGFYSSLSWDKSEELVKINRKRPHPNDEEEYDEFHLLKKMKYTDIRCRTSIRPNLIPTFPDCTTTKILLDKATQTD